jgi:hypothetical protein
MKSEQKYSSKDTSLNQIPGLHRAFVRMVRASGGPLMADCVVDFGAGRYDAAGEYLTAELGVDYYPQDRYNRTEDENQRALMVAVSCNAVGLCANVLNVIAEPEARRELIQLMAYNVTGPCLFTVYEGDRSGEGRQTTKGWQNNRKTADYVAELRAEFDTVERKGNVLICTTVD